QIGPGKSASRPEYRLGRRLGPKAVRAQERMATGLDAAGIIHGNHRPVRQFVPRTVAAVARNISEIRLQHDDPIAPELVRITIFRIPRPRHRVITTVPNIRLEGTPRRDSRILLILDAAERLTAALIVVRRPGKPRVRPPGTVSEPHFARVDICCRRLEPLFTIRVHREPQALIHQPVSMPLCCVQCETVRWPVRNLDAIWQKPHPGPRRYVAGVWAGLLHLELELQLQR